MKITLNILLLFVLFQSSAQNLVPDPGFEDTVFCPMGTGTICNSPVLWDLTYWYAPTCASSDHFHECSTHPSSGVPSNFMHFNLPAHNGKGYGGLYVIDDYREYLTSILSAPLTTNTKYFVSFYVKIPCGAWISSYPCDYYCCDDDIGAYFSIGPPDTVAGQTGSLNVTAQFMQSQYGLIADTLNWQRVCGSFIADGGEDHITIGNFEPSGGGGGYYYYIDDVTVSTDSLICLSGEASLLEYNYSNKKMIRIIDTMGRETEDKPNTVLIYIYSDGTTEKVFRVE